MTGGAQQQDRRAPAANVAPMAAHPGSRSVLSPRRVHRALVAAVLAVATLALAPGSAGAATTVRPGDQLYSPTADGGTAQCTANFVFTNGFERYIGLAAHCFGLGESTDTNGCLTPSLPTGTPVRNVDDEVVGTLAYSSWLTMHAIREGILEVCENNDFALVRLAAGVGADPRVPRWGGPTALAPAGAPAADTTVYSYGNSGLRLGLTQLSPKSGYGVVDSPRGWGHSVYTVTPGIPGDSGSGFLDEHGRAMGVLSTVAVTPLPASNGVSDLGRMLGYANLFGGLGTVSLVTGGPFTGGLPL